MELRPGHRTSPDHLGSSAPLLVRAAVAGSPVLLDHDLRALPTPGDLHARAIPTQDHL